MYKWHALRRQTVQLPTISFGSMFNYLVPIFFVFFYNTAIDHSDVTTFFVSLCSLLAAHAMIEFIHRRVMDTRELFHIVTTA